MASKKGKILREEPQPISKSKAEVELSSGDIERMCRALVGLAFYESDWEWVQEYCLSLTKHDDPKLRASR